MDNPNDFLTWLENLSSLALVGLSCLVLGYALKLAPKFPNGWIPFVCIVWAMVLTPLIDEGRGKDEVTRVWLGRHILFGLVVGFAAWFLHAQILKRFEERIPWIGKLLADAKKPEEIKPEK